MVQLHLLEASFPLPKMQQICHSTLTIFPVIGASDPMLIQMMERGAKQLFLEPKEFEYQNTLVKLINGALQVLPSEVVRNKSEP